MKELLSLILLWLTAGFTIPAFAQSFTKVTTGPVTTRPGDSRSVNWVDIDGDSRLDLQITNGPGEGQDNFLYRNTGAGFAAVANDPIVQDNAPSDGATWADWDNDGDLDCFVVNWYDTNNIAFQNDGLGNFTRIGQGAWVREGGYSETAAWGDYDNDGLVDLYVTNSDGNFRNFLYHNDGGGSFSKVTTGRIVTDGNASRGANWTDMDQDGDLDLFVTNEGGQGENVYRNDGAGVFTSITTGGLVTNAGNTMSASWGDYDNDGDLDVFLANDRGTNALFRNDGGLNFTKMVALAQSGARSFSSAWTDVDNDGDLDLFVTNSFGTRKLANYYYLNEGNGSFTRQTSGALVADSGFSYGCAFGDYDNDGFQDLAVATCRYANVDQPDLLYHNDGNANHWLLIGLVGTQSNRSAIGARVRVRATLNGITTWQMREISAQSGYCSQNDMRAHFGLLDAAAADSIVIEWPSGRRERYAGVAADRILTATEGAGLTTGLKERRPARELSLSPNPARGKVTVRVPGHWFSAGDCVTVVNAQGAVMSTVTVRSASDVVEVDTEALGLARGRYSIAVRQGRNELIKSLVID